MIKLFWKTVIVLYVITSNGVAYSDQNYENYPAEISCIDTQVITADFIKDIYQNESLIGRKYIWTNVGKNKYKYKNVADNSIVFDTSIWGANSEYLSMNGYKTKYLFNLKEDKYLMVQALVGEDVPIQQPPTGYLITGVCKFSYSTKESSGLGEPL